MCMTLVLDYWETLSLTAGCNLYSAKFRLCVLTVKSADQRWPGAESSKLDTNMYFRERDKPIFPSETFLAIAVPKMLIGVLIIFLNLLAIITMFRSNRWISISQRNGSRKGFYILPQTTQGLLHSLFVSYLAVGCLTLYSQLSLSAFILWEWRFVEDQGKECLLVNSLLIGLSLAVALHLLSLAVDRTLASYLPYQKYSSLSKGTVPLWLLAIWLPSSLVGALPLAGWKSNFSFCLFFHQFNDDYLRFVSGFFLAVLLLIPSLYFFFLVGLRKTDDARILYRWFRKLQAHHRLTFLLVMVVNIICWTPFHIYIFLSCLTCPYAYWGSGFTLEYLFMLALVPSLLIPLMFSIRSSTVDKCVNKISKCVHFHFGADDDVEDGRDENIFNNPLSKNSPLKRKSPLFFIDDILLSATTTTNTNSVPSSSNSMKYGKNREGVRKEKKQCVSNRTGSNNHPTFFAPHYLPKSQDGEWKKTKRPAPPIPTHNTKKPRGLEENYPTLDSKMKEMNRYGSSDSKYGFPILPNSHGTKTRVLKKT